MIEIIISGLLTAFLLGIAGSLSKNEFLPFAVAHYSFLSIGLLAFLHLPVEWYPLLTPVLLVLLGTSGSALSLSLALGIGLYLLSGSQIPLTAYLIGSFSFNPFIVLALLVLPGLYVREVLMAWFFPEMARAAGVPRFYEVLPLIFIGLVVAASVQAFGMLFVPPLTVFPAAAIHYWANRKWRFWIFSLASGSLAALAFLVALAFPTLPLGIVLTLVLFLFGGIGYAYRVLKPK